MKRRIDFSPASSSSAQMTDVSTERYSDHFEQSEEPLVFQHRHVYSEDEQEAQVYASLFHGGGMLGFSYYETENSQLHVMKDKPDVPPEFEILKSVLNQINPDHVVLSSKTDERIVGVVNKYYDCRKKINTKDEEEEIDGRKQFVEFSPNLDFSLPAAKRRLSLLRLPSLPMESNRMIFIRSLTDSNCPCMVKATGGLLRYLDRKRIGIQLEDDGIQVPVLALNLFSFSLHIFQREWHPSVYKSGSYGTKEGLSLFGIFDSCRSSLGSKKLRLMFLRPTQDVEVLQRRHDAIEFVANHRNTDVVNLLTAHIKHIKNVPRILSNMIKSSVKITDWMTLYKTIYHAILIGNICRNQPQNIHIFEKISDQCNEDMCIIADLIDRIVNFDESINQGRFVIKSGISEDIDDKKRTYNGLPELMTKVARQELNLLGPDIEECNVVYLPQLGYMLAIPISSEQRATNTYDMTGLDFIFVSNNLVYYKSGSTKELDELLGDTQWDIADEETKIMHWLQNRVLESSEVILDTISYVADLDCLISMGLRAKQSNLVKPCLTDAQIIDVTDGRHVLQELCVSAFVPNDIRSDQQCGKMKAITGPNASGKSVYLKQVALIVYLAHVGSYVPAKQATIGLVDKIYTRLDVPESVSVGLSSFMVDLQQVSFAVNGATSKSLVIIDEFGKGTLSADGLGILAAVLKFWLRRGSACPHVFVNTHFHSLHELLRNQQQLEYLTMKILQPSDEIIFTYKLIKDSGSSLRSSYGCETASQAGLDKRIVERAKQVTELMKANESVARNLTVKFQKTAERCEKILSTFLNTDLEAVDPFKYLSDILKF